mmetsp:Transcript_102177/g.288633  ORF Transcript_102177/g.288633 Transcript_102177/m.288633 type:complete len:703 (-) Transcript_102177:146-2254(-)
MWAHENAHQMTGQVSDRPPSWLSNVQTARTSQRPESYGVQMHQVASHSLPTQRPENVPMPQNTLRKHVPCNPSMPVGYAPQPGEDPRSPMRQIGVGDRPHHSPTREAPQAMQTPRTGTSGSPISGSSPSETYSELRPLRRSDWSTGVPPLVIHDVQGSLPPDEIESPRQDKRADAHVIKKQSSPNVPMSPRKCPVNPGARQGSSALGHQLAVPSRLGKQEVRDPPLSCASTCLLSSGFDNRVPSGALESGGASSAVDSVGQSPPPGKMEKMAEEIELMRQRLEGCEAENAQLKEMNAQKCEELRNTMEALEASNQRFEDHARELARRSEEHARERIRLMGEAADARKGQAQGDSALMQELSRRSEEHTRERIRLLGEVDEARKAQIRSNTALLEAQRVGAAQQSIGVQTDEPRQNGRRPDVSPSLAPQMQLQFASGDGPRGRKAPEKQEQRPPDCGGHRGPGACLTPRSALSASQHSSPTKRSVDFQEQGTTAAVAAIPTSAIDRILDDLNSAELQDKIQAIVKAALDQHLQQANRAGPTLIEKGSEGLNACRAFFAQLLVSQHVAIPEAPMAVCRQIYTQAEKQLGDISSRGADTCKLYTEQMLRWMRDNMSDTQTRRNATENKAIAKKAARRGSSEDSQRSQDRRSMQRRSRSQSVTMGKERSGTVDKDATKRTVPQPGKASAAGYAYTFAASPSGTFTL